MNPDLILETPWAKAVYTGLVIFPVGAVDMGLDPYSIIAPRHAEIDRAPGDGRFGSCCDGSTPHLL